MAQNPTTTHWIIKSKNGIGLYSSKSLTKQSRPGTAAVRVHTKNTSSERCVGLQPRCANAVATPLRSQTTASCRSTRAQTSRKEEQRIQRASFVATYPTRVHTAAAAVGHRAGLGCLVEKNTTSRASARLFAARLESVSAGLDARVQGRAKCTGRFSSWRQT